MAIVSILMNCYNGEKYLQQALDSVYNQTFTDWEILFVDNCSSDRTKEITKPYDGRLRYFLTKESMRLYQARNYGLNFLTGKYVAFLDVDDYWYPNKLMTQVNYLEYNKNCYLVDTGYDIVDEYDNRIGESCFNIEKHEFRKLVNKYTIDICTVLLRADVFREHGFSFNDTMNLAGDYELFMRILYLYQGEYISDTLSASRRHADNLSKTMSSDWPNEIRRANFSIKNYLELNYLDKGLLNYFTAKSYIKHIFQLARKGYAHSI